MSYRLLEMLAADGAAPFLGELLPGLRDPERVRATARRIIERSPLPDVRESRISRMLRARIGPDDFDAIEAFGDWGFAELAPRFSDGEDLADLLQDFAYREPPFETPDLVRVLKLLRARIPERWPLDADDPRAKPASDWDRWRTETMAAWLEMPDFELLGPMPRASGVRLKCIMPVDRSPDGQRVAGKVPHWAHGPS